MNAPVDFAGLRQSIDLRRFVASDLGPPLEGGRWPCPIHGGKRPNFAIFGDRWKCWSCGETGDVFDYLARREGITVVEAAARLDSSGSFSRAAARRDALPGTTPRYASAVTIGTGPPDTLAPAAARTNEAAYRKNAVVWRDSRWQAAVDAIVRQAQAVLWSREGRPALDWLRARGLHNATIRRFRLGFLPDRVPSEIIPAFGLNDCGEPRRIWASRGITIPWLRPGSWYDETDDGSDDPGPRWVGCNVRRLPFGDVFGPLPETVKKYRAFAGSERGHAYPWPEAAAIGEPAVVCEGEFDALVGWQEVGWIGNVVSFGGAGQSQLQPDARAFLAACPDWLLLFDFDDAGDGAARSFMKRAPHRCRRLYLPPGVNDLTDLHKSGRSVLAWLRDEYARFGWPWRVWSGESLAEKIVAETPAAPPLDARPCAASALNPPVLSDWPPRPPALATWPESWRKRWGIRATELETAGTPWQFAEWQGFGELVAERIAAGLSLAGSTAETETDRHAAEPSPALTAHPSAGRGGRSGLDGRPTEPLHPRFLAMQ